MQSSETWFAATLGGDRPIAFPQIGCARRVPERTICTGSKQRSTVEPVRSGPLPARGLVCSVGRLSEF